MSALGVADYARLSAVQIAAGVAAHRLSAAETVRCALERAAALDGDLCAFTWLWPDEAAARAADIDRRVRAGARLPLAGVPIGVKASQGLDADQTRRLIEAGCIPIGATATPGRCHRGRRGDGLRRAFSTLVREWIELGLTDAETDQQVSLAALRRAIAHATQSGHAA